ncbi:MAG: class I SAM-dependent methyltransferase [Acetobacteraceae bacterium]|nr:class I SAM-dependent methyltransferase [Acetobacteraceae bacterium]MBV8525608.1 class I SAM-dependent methyltransferase [Acetobacteraceae bacterium]
MTQIPPSPPKTTRFVWPNPSSPNRTLLPCPNCGSFSAKPLILEIESPFGPNGHAHYQLRACPECSCRFYENQPILDYTEPDLFEQGRGSFYIQQGAGLGLFAHLLGRIPRPPGTTYWDVGCGFGFALDFAVHELGWEGEGIDPAAATAYARNLLGLKIEERHLTEQDARRTPKDVVMASETLEHMPSPGDFVRLLRAALKPGGILVLTTPNADMIPRLIEEGTASPYLSPGLHLVLQTEKSLGLLLQAAGFAHASIEPQGCGLTAYASERPFSLETDLARPRARYRAYLARRAASVPEDSDLFLGFAGRAFTEASNDGAGADAEHARAQVAPVLRRRFGIDLDNPASLPQEAESATLERMAELMPLNLPGLLYARAQERLAQGEDRAAVETQFEAAARTAKWLRRSLNEIGMDDALTSDIGWTAQAEGALCAAARGDPDVASRFAALERSGAAAARRPEFVQRALTSLLNAGRAELGRVFADAERLTEAHWADPAGKAALSTAERDALFSLAVLDTKEGGNPARARAYFARVREGLTPGADGTGLFWEAARGEILAAKLAGGRGLAALHADLLAKADGDWQKVPGDLRPDEATRAQPAPKAS